MQLTLEPKAASSWRGRGRPPRVVPAHIAAEIDRAYRTKQVGVVRIEEHDTESEIEELISILNAHARVRGKRMRIQRDDESGEIRFEMKDRGKK